MRLIGIVRNERGEKDYVNHVMDFSDDIAAELKRQKSLISTHNSAKFVYRYARRSGDCGQLLGRCECSFRTGRRARSAVS